MTPPDPSTPSEFVSHPFTRRIVDLVSDGAIGRVLSVEVSYTASAPFNPSSRLFDKALAGGAILDVSGYPVSFAAMVGGASLSADGVTATFAEPTSVRAGGTLGHSGVDDWAIANLVYSNGMSAHVSTGRGVTGANTPRPSVADDELGRQPRQPQGDGRLARPTRASLRRGRRCGRDGLTPIDRRARWHE